MLPPPLHTQTHFWGSLIHPPVEGYCPLGIHSSQSKGETHGCVPCMHAWGTTWSAHGRWCPYKVKCNIKLVHAWYIFTQTHVLNPVVPNKLPHYLPLQPTGVPGIRVATTGVTHWPFSTRYKSPTVCTVRTRSEPPPLCTPHVEWAHHWMGRAATVTTHTRKCRGNLHNVHYTHN